MLDILSKEPDYINDEGTKWWRDIDTTNYAKSKKITDISIWIIEDKSKYRTRVIVRDSIIIDEDQTLDGICIKIDMMSLNLIYDTK